MEVPLPSDKIIENCGDDSSCSNASCRNSTVSGPIEMYEMNYCCHHLQKVATNNLPDVSFIITTVESALPIKILLVSNSLEFIERVNNSVPSKMVSLCTSTLKVISVSPAGTITLCGPEA